MENLGLIHIYTGEGKGKTTASIGLTIRMLGNGGKVIFSQFLKSWNTGEVSVLESLHGVKVIRNSKPFPFTNQMTDEQKNEIVTIHNNLLEAIKAELKKEKYHMIVMDEIMATYNLKLIDTELVDDFIKNKPKDIELVLTGRDPEEKFIKLADYVSDIHKVKHPFDKGVESRKGIES